MEASPFLKFLDRFDFAAIIATGGIAEIPFGFNDPEAKSQTDSLSQKGRGGARFKVPLTWERDLGLGLFMP